MNLADALVSKSYNDGDVIVNQGAIGDGMYFVEDGSINIVMDGNDGIERTVYLCLIILTSSRYSDLQRSKDRPLETAFFPQICFFKFGTGTSTIIDHWKLKTVIS